jgi:branched-chain amino acid aminotransferase
MSLIWINGQLIDKSEARVSPFDHGFLYGDGVWEHFRVFAGTLFRPDYGIRELFGHLQFLGIELPLSDQSLLEAIDHTLRANQRDNGYVRVLVSRGSGTIGPDPRKIDPQVIIIAEEYRPFPPEIEEHGLEVVVHYSCLIHHEWYLADRLLGRPHVVVAKRDALTRGCLEAVCCDLGRYVLGGTEGSVFRVRPQKGVELLDCMGARDVTAFFVNEVATVRPFLAPGELPSSVLMEADELFLAGTTCGIIPIVKVDGNPIGSGTEGPVTRRIREAYRRLTRGGG